MTLNTYLNRFRCVTHTNRAMLWNASDILMELHVPSLTCILMEQHPGVRGGKIKPLFPRLYISKCP